MVKCFSKYFMIGSLTFFLFLEVIFNRKKAGRGFFVFCVLVRQKKNSPNSIPQFSNRERERVCERNHLGLG